MARSIVHRIKPDDLLLISGHGPTNDLQNNMSFGVVDRYILPPKSATAWQVVKILAEAGLSKRHRSVISLACRAGGEAATVTDATHAKATFNKAYGDFQQPYRVAADKVLADFGKSYKFTNSPKEPDPTEYDLEDYELEDEKYFQLFSPPLAHHLATEFGKCGYGNIQVGGLPGKLYYANIGKEQKIVADRVPSGLSGYIFFRANGVAGKAVLADLDHIRWYNHKGFPVIPERCGPRFIAGKWREEQIVFETLSSKSFEKHLSPVLAAQVRAYWGYDAYDAKFPASPHERRIQSKPHAKRPMHAYKPRQYRPPQ